MDDDEVVAFMYCIFSVFSAPVFTLPQRLIIILLKYVYGFMLHVHVLDI